MATKKPAAKAASKPAKTGTVAARHARELERQAAAKQERARIIAEQ